MASRHFLVVVLCTTMSFSMFGVYRIQRAVLVSDSIFESSRRRHREMEEYEAFYVPAASRKDLMAGNAISTPNIHNNNPQDNNNNNNHHGRQLSNNEDTQAVQQQEAQRLPPLVTPSQKKKKIRSWGCEPHAQAPFVFVHIGKAGGGSTKGRLSAAVQPDWEPTGRELSHAFNMTLENGDQAPAAVVVSHFPNFRPSYNVTHPQDTPEDWSTYEGTIPCGAETPIGQAIACPILRRPALAEQACHDKDHNAQCNVVYAGHNLLGNELHWLPNQYLANWWKSYQKLQDNEDALYDAFLHRSDDWTKSADESKCWFAPEKNTSGMMQSHFRSNYLKCVQPKFDRIDSLARDALTDMTTSGDWSPLYASLPVLRVTVLREPMSWLVSKFFWHSKAPGYWRGLNGRRHYGLVTCDNSDRAVPGSDSHLDVVVDWVSHAALTYMYYLCGEDCVVRMKHGTMNLDQLEVQARRNLQQSFAVVGLLEEMPTFYNMLSARATYLDTSHNLHIEGEHHKSGAYGSVQDSQERCKDLFTSRNEFVRTITGRSPELAALRRLYRVGREVSHAQRDELYECGSMTSEHAAEA